MIIGIDASRAFVKNKTGIEEYSYQVIKHLRNYLRDNPVILYLDPRVNKLKYVGFELPENWKTKSLRAPKFWTQIRLSFEMLFHPVDILFIPAHTVPVFHPKNTVVTIHGLEYEFCPKAYSWFERLYMRWSIRKSCRWAKKVIAVSENTKRDLMRLYKVPEEKIEVIYEGIPANQDSIISLSADAPNSSRSNISNSEYLLFVGRLEERKNITGIVEAFEVLKRKYKILHKLILVGKFGFGEEKIKNRIDGSQYKSDIILTGYVSDEDKFYLMANSDAFLFPTFYEGFGLPILEAQSAGTPVVTSNISSMPEVVRLRQGSDGQAVYSAVLVDPEDPYAIADSVYKLISDESYKNDIIEKGLENVKRFSWKKCAENIAAVIQKNERM